MGAACRRYSTTLSCWRTTRTTHPFSFAFFTLASAILKRKSTKPASDDVLILDGQLIYALPFQTPSGFLTSLLISCSLIPYCCNFFYLAEYDVAGLVKNTGLGVNSIYQSWRGPWHLIRSYTTLKRGSNSFGGSWKSAIRISFLSGSLRMPCALLVPSVIGRQTIKYW